MEEKREEELLTKATGDMVEALNKYGASDVLDLLVRFSDQDWALKQLLVKFPSVVSVSHFMFKKPLFKIKGLSVKEFFDTHCPIRIKKEKVESNERKIGKKVGTQKKRNGKQTQKCPEEGVTERLKRTGDKTGDPPDTRENVMKEVSDEAKLELGWALLDRKEYEAGLILFKSLPWNTCGEEKYCGIGRGLIGTGRFDEAKNILTIGLKNFPQSYILWTDMGILYDGLGDYPEALRFFEIAISITGGENPACLYNKALILIKLHEYNNAMSIIDDLIERFPEEPKYLSEKGCCLREMGYPHEAIKYLQRAMGLFKKSPTVDVGVTIFSGLCCAYRDLSMTKEATEIALEGLTRFPDSDPVLYHNLATCFYELGWTADSRRLLQIAVEKFPDDAELNTFLKDVEDDLDDPDSDLNPLLSLLLLTALIHKKLKEKC